MSIEDTLKADVALAAQRHLPPPVLLLFLYPQLHQNWRGAQERIHLYISGCFLLAATTPSYVLNIAEDSRRLLRTFLSLLRTARVSAASLTLVSPACASAHHSQLMAPESWQEQQQPRSRSRRYSCWQNSALECNARSIGFIVNASSGYSGIAGMSRRYASCGMHKLDRSQALMKSRETIGTPNLIAFRMRCVRLAAAS